MIELIKLKKSYVSGYPAVNDLSMTMRDREVFGLVGTNGAGKTTLLRMMAGILRQDEGTILIDGEKVYDAPEVKKNLYFIPDEPYFFPNANARDMAKYDACVYESFSMRRFEKLTEDFGLDPTRRLSAYSKGMKKQLMIILGLSAKTKYLFCDETFDGLDPVMRQATKSLFAKEMEDRGLTPILTSHNLRELEDICDHIGLLHQGGVLLSKDIANMKVDIQKIQVVFRTEEAQQQAEKELPILEHHTQGKLHVYTVRKSPAELEIIFNSIDTVLFEILPLTLEEIFISETEVVGYDIKKIIQG